jgi:Calpain family cysteine protease
VGNYVYSDKDLYGPSHRPQPSDIRQQNIGDCGFDSTLGSLAGQQPGRIEQAIRYDAKTQDFTVTLYKPGAGGKAEPVHVKVSQADIKMDVADGGNTTGFNHSRSDTPIWPAVYEAAYAKISEPNTKAGIKAGFQKIEGGGIWPTDAQYLVTGIRGETVKAADVQRMGMDDAYKRLHAALQERRPIELSTKGENPGAPKDGLVNHHVYMVEAVYKDKNGVVMVTLRNPWGTNKPVLEGHDKVDARITVKLKDITQGGGLDRIDIGPSPAQKPELVHPNKQHASIAPTGDKSLDKLFAAMRDPAALKQALTDFANSSQGQAIRAESRAQYAELQNQQLQAQPTQQQNQSAPTVAPQGPVMTR